MDFFIQALYDLTSSLKKELNVNVHHHPLAEGVYDIRTEGQLPILFYKDAIATIDTGRHVIHITYQQWDHNKRIILNRIAAIWGKAEKVHARKTTCKRVGKPDAATFLEENHLMVPSVGKYRYGLFSEDNLVSLAVFSGLRNMRYAENYKSIELIRFCHKGKIIVVGGLSKLIKTMVRELQPDDVMTYVDKNWSDGTKFEKIGFERTGAKTIEGTPGQSIKLILVSKNITG